MKVTVLSMMEFKTYPAPGETLVLVRTTYKTETGFQGTIDTPLADFSKEKIIEEITKDIPEGTELIGQEIDIGPKIEETEE